MNRLLRYILMVLAAGFLYGCTEEFTDYTPGLPDDLSNYGVYFPRQSSSTSLELEAGDPQKNVTYKIRRTFTKGDITVPVRMEASEENIFIVSPIRFDDGEREAEFTIQFPRIEAGKEYTLTLTIDDPQYVSTYNGYDTALTLSVVCANWELLGKGKWRDDILSSIYVNVPNAYAEVDVDIYERKDAPGMYRMEVFTQSYVQKLFGGMAESATGGYTIVDATDPEKVWIPHQDTGLVLTSQHGSVIIASSVDKIFSMDESASQYGKLDENGVITFPIQGVLAQLANIHSSEEWIGANASGKLRIMLPGARLLDYSLTAKRNDSAVGQIGADLTAGQDVASVKYAVAEGRLDAGQVSLTAQSLDAGELQFAGELKDFDTITSETGDVNKKKHLDVKPEQTGLYTLICCSYSSNGQMQDYAYMTFGYVSDGDSKDVVMTVAVEQTNELQGEGYDKTNSVKFYGYGEDVYSLRYALRRADRIADNISDEEIVEKFGTDLTASELDTFNNGTYTKTFVRLNSGSDFILYVRADNGYTTEIRKIEFRTEGQYNPLLDGWTNSDFMDNNPMTIAALTQPTWNLYAYDLMDTSPQLKFLGEVTISENMEDVSGRALYIRGIMSDIEVDDGQGQDENGRMNLIPGNDIQLIGSYDEYWSVRGVEGPIYGTFTIPASFESTPVATHYMDKIMLVYYCEETLAGYASNADSKLDGMVVGQVYDGCMAFAPNPFWKGQLNFTFSFMGFTSYYTPYALYMNMVLVDKEKDLGLPKNPPQLNDVLTQVTASSQASADAAAMRNYVETEYDFADYVERYKEYLNWQKGTSNFGEEPALAPAVKIVRTQITEGGDGDGVNGERPAEPMLQSLKVQNASALKTLRK